MKFGSKKAIFGVFFVVEGFGPCLGISHPTLGVGGWATHLHLGKNSQKTFFWEEAPLIVTMANWPSREPGPPVLPRPSGSLWPPGTSGLPWRVATMAIRHQGTRGIRDTEPVRLAHLNIIPTGAQGTKTISTTRYVHNIIPSFSLSMAVKENPFLHHNHPTVFC